MSSSERDAACLSQEAMRSIEDHVEQCVGRCENVLHESESEVVHLDLLPVELVDDDGDEYLFVCTMGMSALPMQFAEPVSGDDAPSPYVELCITLPGAWPYTPEAFDEHGDDAYWPFGWLKMIARMTHGNGGSVEAGECFPNDGDPPAPFTEECGFVAMFILPAEVLTDGLGRMEAGTHRVDFLMLVPIFLDEYELLEREGPQALLNAFHEAELPTMNLADPARPSACSSR